MYETIAFAKKTQESEGFEKIKIKRNDLGPDDVEFDVKFCGVCHTDVHIAENDMGSTKYPCVPGHELAGTVTRVGKNVKKVKAGDDVGVGCIVDSCLTCSNCKSGDEHICDKGMTMTYDSDIKHGHIGTDSGYTYGGYSKRTTVNEQFIAKIPKGYPMEFAGPVFCAGVTMYSPLKHWGATKGGMNIGIVGIGGLGQMGVRLAKAMGNTVTAISTSPNKEAVAKSIGASNFVVSKDEASMAKAAKSLDLILNTVSANHQAATYLSLLKQNGTLVQLGLVLEPHSVMQMQLMLTRTSLAGSMIGGMADTQEVIDFCHKHGLKPEIELITHKDLPKVYKILNGKNDSIKRYVIDIEKSDRA